MCLIRCCCYSYDSFGMKPQGATDTVHFDIRLAGDLWWLLLPSLHVWWRLDDVGWNPFFQLGVVSIFSIRKLGGVIFLWRSPWKFGEMIQVDQYFFFKWVDFSEFSALASSTKPWNIQQTVDVPEHSDGVSSDKCGWQNETNKLGSHENLKLLFGWRVLRICTCLHPRLIQQIVNISNFLVLITS